jgi:nuclear pore complex protein Nup160
VKEAYFTLRLEFQDQILPGGVAFADLETNDEIHAFVGTDRDEIFDLRLPTHAFRDAEALSPENIGHWCEPFQSSSLDINTVHRIWANSPLEVFISFTSGKLQKSTRRSLGGSWKHDIYDDRTWGASIRGIVSRRGLQMIESGSRQLDPRTTQALVTSGDGKFMFTVCLNHTLRVWNLLEGKVVVTKDLLDAVRDPNDRTHLNPREDALLKIFRLPLQRNPVLLTYSPQDGGQFKFWDLKGGTTDPLTVEDKYPQVKLSSPDPDPSGNTIWSMVGLKLDAGSDVKPAQIWVLWRNHNYHQLYKCEFEFPNLVSTWEDNWVKCAATASAKNVAPDLVRSDFEDPASKWLDFFFSPGRYSEAGLETALSIFEEATTVKLPASQKTAPLGQRMCAVVGASVSLRKYEDFDLDFDRFYADTDAHWRNLYRIVENVNDSRNAPLSLAYDAYCEMVWITMTDKCCAVRECSKLELLQQNDLADMENLEDVTARAWPHRKVSTDDGESFADMGVLISASRSFRESFTAELAKSLQVAIDEDMSVGAEYVTPTRIFEIYDSTGFSDAVSNEVFERLEADLTPVGGLSSLNNELFLSTLELLAVKSKRTKSALRNTLFGSCLLSAGIRDFIHSQRQLLMDLLTLTIFVEGELNQEDAKMTGFDAAELYSYISPLLRLCDRTLWLTSHTRSKGLEILGADTHANAHRRSSVPPSGNHRQVTIFEDTLSKAVRPQPAVDRPLMYLLTDQLFEIDDWASGKDTIAPEDGAVYLQCDLLRHGELDLAADFLKFQPSTAWSNYVKGRLALERGEHDMAATYFQSASYGLACGKAVGNLVALSAGLLSVIDADCFNGGLPIYLHHIMGLFEGHDAYDGASQFAHLALKALHSDQPEPVPNFRAEVLSRLFNAELKLSRFRRAYDALVQQPDAALQKSAVHSLVDAILDPHKSLGDTRGAVRILQALPWNTHPELAYHMDQHLVGLTQKQTSLAGGVDYLGVTYAMRIAQRNYRGAVTVLYERLLLVRQSGRARHDPQATALRHVLLSLVNVMASVAPQEAYIVAEPAKEKHADAEQQSKRRRIIITLEDLRKEYQQVLDRCSRIERGDFDFEMDDDDESEDDDEAPVNHSRLNLSSHNSGDSMEF